MKDCRALSSYITYCVEDGLLLALACTLAAYDAALACPSWGRVALPLRSYVAFWMWPALTPICVRAALRRSRCPVRPGQSPFPLLRYPAGSHATSGAPFCERPSCACVSRARRILAMLSDLSPPIDDDRHPGDTPLPLRVSAALHRVPPRTRAGCHRAVLHVCGHTRIGGGRAIRRTRATPGRPLPCRVLARLVSLSPTLVVCPCAAVGIPAGSLTLARTVRVHRAAVRQHHDGRGRHSESFRPRAGRSCVRHRANHWR